MILNKQELDELNAQLNDCYAKLKELRLRKISHYAHETVFDRFGCQLDNVGIVVNQNGERFVLADMEEQIAYNYNESNFGSMVWLCMRKISKNGKLSKRYTVLFSTEKVTRTGEQYNG